MGTWKGPACYPAPGEQVGERRGPPNPIDVEAEGRRRHRVDLRLKFEQTLVTFGRLAEASFHSGKTFLAPRATEIVKVGHIRSCENTGSAPNFVEVRVAK